MCGENWDWFHVCCFLKFLGPSISLVFLGVDAEMKPFPWRCCSLWRPGALTG